MVSKNFNYTFNHDKAIHDQDIPNQENLTISMEEAINRCNTNNNCGGILINNATNNKWLKNTNAGNMAQQNKWSEASNNWSFATKPALSKPTISQPVVKNNYNFYPKSADSNEFTVSHSSSNFNRPPNTVTNKKANDRWINTGGWNTTSGMYGGNASLGGIRGEWIRFDVNNNKQFKLTGGVIQSAYTNYNVYPRELTIIGSNDMGKTWEKIHYININISGPNITSKNINKSSKQILGNSEKYIDENSHPILINNKRPFKFPLVPNSRVLTFELKEHNNLYNSIAFVFQRSTAYSGQRSVNEINLGEIELLGEFKSVENFTIKQGTCIYGIDGSYKVF